MLPDYPVLKDRFRQYLNKRIQSIANTSPMNRAKRVRCYEGDANSILREDGTGESRPFMEISSTVSVDRSDIEEVRLEELLAKVDKMAEDLVRQQTERLFRSVGEVAESVGNSISTNNQPFSAEHFLAMLEKMAISFDSRGRVKGLEFYVSPGLAPRVLEQQKRIETDPDLRQRYEDIMVKKREEWREREASRKLVG